MVFHVRWISHHSSPNPTLVAMRLGRDSETRGEKKPISHGKPYKMHIILYFETLFEALALDLILLLHHNMPSNYKGRINDQIRRPIIFIQYYINALNILKLCH